MRLRARIRRWCDGIGGFIAVAVLCLVFGLLGIAVEAQDPSRLRWTGDKVSAYTEGGIAFYTYHGERYTMNARGVPAGSPREPATVYVDPDDPTTAWMYTRVDDLTTGLYIVLPFTLSVGVVAAGVIRRSLHARKRLRIASLPSEETFGEGLDEGFVLRALANMRREGGSLHDQR